ncbi:MAG: anaerobic ribonucleoside-triphosphate reductase activating protein, partial [Candidatus Hydrogenedens sp.]
MKIGGFQPFSLSDFPNCVSAIVFTQGCNFRCPFCHNPSLVLPELFLPPIPEEALIAFLNERKGKLDGVVITGGEPTIQSDLMKFVSEIKGLGYKVKLDTNGSNPEILKELIENNLLDYVAMDVKAP